MTLEEIKRHRHYKPAGHSPVCGFSRKVMDAVDAGQTPGLEYAILKVRGTTDVRGVSCPDCQRWLIATVNQYPV